MTNLNTVMNIAQIFTRTRSA